MPVRRRFFADLSDANGLMVSAGLAELGVKVELTSGDAFQVNVLGDLNGLMLNVLESAFGAQRVVILHSNLASMFMAGGLEAEIASGVAVHELNHALRDSTDSVTAGSRDRLRSRMQDLF